MTKRLVSTARAALIALATALSLLTLLAPSARAAEPVRAISEIGNGIYRFQNDTHYSVFIVGKKGLLMTDPINADAARWLRAEIDRRFGKLPVQYLVYSHNHGDHVFGGEVWKDPATRVIAQRKAAADLRRNRAPTALPDLTFDDRLQIDFEGRAVELRYHGPNNGAGSISLYVPDAKFLFVVDWIVLGRLPWMELYYYDLDGMIDSLHQALALDFTLVAPGHGAVGGKSEVREFLAYLEDLRGAVLDGMNAGKSLARLQQEIRLEKYAGYAKYREWLPLNIKGAYEQLARTSGRFGQEK